MNQEKSDSLKALEIIKGKFNILPPLTTEEVESKIEEVEWRMIKNLPQKLKQESAGLSQEEIMERLYSRGNKVD